MNIVIVGTQNIKKCIFDITDVAFRNPFGKYIFIFALTFQYSVPSLVLSWALSRSFKYSSTLLLFFFLSFECCICFYSFTYIDSFIMHQSFVSPPPPSGPGNSGAFNFSNLF